MGVGLQLELNFSWTSVEFSVGVGVSWTSVAVGLEFDFS